MLGYPLGINEHWVFRILGLLDLVYLIVEICIYGTSIKGASMPAQPIHGSALPSHIWLYASHATAMLPLSYVSFSLYYPPCLKL